MSDAMTTMLSMTDLYLPSGDELTLLTEAPNSKDAITELLHRGVQAIVHKRGADGATYYDGNATHAANACPVHEIDPTGAGDCFGGTFTALWLQGVDPEKALRLAAASGALAVTMRGPMEGTATLDELETFNKEMATA
jgi:sugar/nucleoside kinase (ribokinase family)